MGFPFAVDFEAVSIHAPLARSNAVVETPDEQAALFQYMLLLRGATGPRACPPAHPAFQYMLLLRGATRTTAKPQRR